MVKTNPKMLLTILIGIMLLSNMVLAVPGIPNAFYGTVTWNGSPAPDGTSVVAKIKGVQVASTTTKGGKYGYEPIFYVDDPYSTRSGSLINFFVNGVDTGQTSYFANGKITLLDLVASGTISQPPSGPGGTGGPVGGTTSGTTETTNQTGVTQQPQPCQERWLCSDWSECKDGQQTRTCEDVNKCGTDEDIPLMAQPCSKEEIEKAEKTEAPLLPTGFFLGLTSTDWLTGIIIGIIAAAIIIFIITRKKKKR